MAQPKKKPLNTKATTKATTKPKVKKTTKPRTSAAKVKTSEYKTLHHSKSAQPFMSVKPTQQTAYWLILGIVVLALGIWIINLQVEINGIYDKIDENQLYYDQVSDLERQIIENKKAIESNSQPTAQ